MLEKEQVKAVLSNRGTNIYYAVNLVKKYIMQREVMVLVIDSIVEQVNATKSKPTAQQLYQYFYTSLSSLMKGTVFGRTDYTAKQFLKNVWNDGEVQAQIIGYFRENGYKKPYITEEVKQAREEKKKVKEVKKSALNARTAKKIKKCRSCNYDTCLNRVTPFEKEFEKTQKSVPVCYKKVKTIVKPIESKEAQAVKSTKEIQKTPSGADEDKTTEQQDYINMLKDM